MDKDKRVRLEAAGFRFTTVAEFLGLSEEENQLVELRVTISKEIRRLRAANHLSQKEVARRMKTSQPRVAKIEAAAEGVSLELMLRELFMLGGRVTKLEFAESTRSASATNDAMTVAGKARTKRTTTKAAE